MDAALVLCFFGAIYGVWHFIAQANYKRHLIVRHLLGSSLGFVLAFIPFVIAISSGQIVKVLMILILLCEFSLGFDSTIKKIAKMLGVEEDESENSVVSKEIAKLRRISAKEKSLSHAPASNKYKSQIINNYSKGDYLIHYTDADGLYSQRTISNVRRRGSNISCHCHLRNETRTFKINRIEEPITCLNTGEMLEKKEWIKTI